MNKIKVEFIKFCDTIDSLRSQLRKLDQERGSLEGVIENLKGGSTASRVLVEELTKINSKSNELTNTIYNKYNKFGKSLDELD